MRLESRLPPCLAPAVATGVMVPVSKLNDYELPVSMGAGVPDRICLADDDCRLFRNGMGISRIWRPEACPGGTPGVRQRQVKT